MRCSIEDSRLDKDIALIPIIRLLGNWARFRDDGRRRRRRRPRLDWMAQEKLP